MLAVIKTGGKQYIVSPKQKLKIEKIKGAEEIGKEITFDEVLLVEDGKNVEIGTPLVTGAKVVAKVIANDKKDKVIVFKYKPKKRYRVKKGHRQPYTEVEILSIQSK